LARWLSNKKYVEALGIHNHIQITLFRCLKARQVNLIVIITFINSDKISTRNNNKKDDPNWAGCLLKDTSSFDASWLRNAPKGWNDFVIFMPSSLHQWLKVNNLLFINHITEYSQCFLPLSQYTLTKILYKGVNFQVKVKHQNEQ